MGAVNLNCFLNRNHILSLVITPGLQVMPEGLAIIGPVSKADRENGGHDCFQLRPWYINGFGPVYNFINVWSPVAQLKIGQRKAAIEFTILKYFLSYSGFSTIPQKMTSNRVNRFKKAFW